MSLWELSEQADILISSPGGYPNDLNLYQSIAIPTRKRPVFKERATIIVVARCQDGIGSSRMYRRLAEAEKLQAVVESGQRASFLDYEPVSYAYAYYLEKYKLSYIVVTEGVSRQDLKSMSVVSTDSLQRAVDTAFERQGPGARVLVLPDSKNIVPRLRQGHDA
jgi:nickel-dependent lactate racemase